MPDLRKAYIRFIEHYLRQAQQNRADPHRITQESANIIRAADLCVELEEWQLLENLTDAFNDYLLRQARYSEYTKFNLPLVINNLIARPDERVSRLKRLIELEEIGGNYVEALRLNKVLIDLYEESGSSIVDAIIEAITHISGLAELQGSYDEAIQYLNTGLSIARRDGRPDHQVDFLFKLSSLHKRNLDFETALTLCDVSLQLARSIGYSSKEVDIFTLRASLCFAQHRLQDAWDSCHAAFKAASRIGDVVRADSIREELARLGDILKRKIFISYNHQDRKFVERLANDLKVAGLPVWWDQWEIRPGDSIVQKVSDGIDGSAYLLAVLSPNSVQSNWVRREIGAGLMKELSSERNITILPLLIADCEVPVLLREIKWADFREQYEISLKSLLDVLVNSAS